MSLSVLLCLGACATKYVPPSDLAGTSRVTYEVSAGAALGYTSSLYIQEAPTSGKCFGNGALVAWINKGNPLGGVTNNPKNVPFVATPKAHFCINIAPAAFDGQRGCNTHLSFEPEAGKYYYISASWFDDRCSAQVFEGEERRKVDFEIGN